MNPFMKFMTEFRAQIKAEHPDWKLTEIAKEGGRRWKMLSDEEKSCYGDLKRRETSPSNFDKTNSDSDEDHESFDELVKSEPFVKFWKDVGLQMIIDHPNWTVKQVKNEAAKKWNSLFESQKASYYSDFLE